MGSNRTWYVQANPRGTGAGCKGVFTFLAGGATLSNILVRTFLMLTSIQNHLPIFTFMLSTPFLGSPSLLHSLRSPSAHQSRYSLCGLIELFGVLNILPSGALGLLPALGQRLWKLSLINFSIDVHRMTGIWWRYVHVLLFYTDGLWLCRSLLLLDQLCNIRSQ